MVLWSFDETTSGEFLCDVPYNNLQFLLNHNHLHTQSEFHLFNVIERWVQADLLTRSTYILDLLKCLRVQSLPAKDILKMLDLEMIKKNTEVFRYVETLLQEKRLFDQEHSCDTSINSQIRNCDENTSSSFSNVENQARQLPVVPCVIGRINPKPKEKFIQKDSIPRLLIYRNGEELNQSFVSFQKIQVHHSFNDESSEYLTLRLTESLNSHGYQITSNGPTFYVTGGEFVLGKDNWNRYIWAYNTINSKWAAVCKLNNVR